jgi:hypothetical protein
VTEDPPQKAERGTPDPKGLRWITTGAILGLVAAVTGLAAPVSLLLLASYSPAHLQTFAPTLIRATAFLVFAGAMLFAISLIAFRVGFATFRTFDERFRSSSILCLIGTVGYALLAVPTAVALLSSDALLQCLQQSPSGALSCLQSVAPLAGYAAVAAFWLVWLGQLGIVVGLVLTGRRFQEVSLYAGTVLYGLLLLVFIAPFIGLVFSSDLLTYVIFGVAALGLLAPAFVAMGGDRARGANPTRSSGVASGRSTASQLLP